MKLTKKDINRIKKAHEKACDLENKLANATGDIVSIIKDITGIEGNTDFLPGDGFGFMPKTKVNECNNNHIGIDNLIKYAEEGIDITEEFILKNLYL